MFPENVLDDPRDLDAPCRGCRERRAETSDGLCEMCNDDLFEMTAQDLADERFETEGDR